MKVKSIDLWSKDPRQLMLEVTHRMYPPSFQITVLSATGGVTGPSFVKVQFEPSTGDHFCITLPLLKVSEHLNLMIEYALQAAQITSNL